MKKGLQTGSYRHEAYPLVRRVAGDTANLTPFMHSHANKLSPLLGMQWVFGIRPIQLLFNIRPNSNLLSGPIAGKFII